MLEASSARRTRAAGYELALKGFGAVLSVAVEHDDRWRRLCLLVQRPALAVLRHDRSMQSLSLAHRLGHRLMGENDDAISLLDRMIQRSRSTARYSVYYGEGTRHVRRAAGLLTRAFSTVTMASTFARARSRGTRHSRHGLAGWRGSCPALSRSSLSFSRRCLIPNWPHSEAGQTSRHSCSRQLEHRATSLSNTPTDGVSVLGYWSTGSWRAEQLFRTGVLIRSTIPSRSTVQRRQSGLRDCGWRSCPEASDANAARHYRQSGLTVAKSLLQLEPYLSTDPKHEGCCCTRSITKPRVGTMCRRARRFRTANPACGATITCVS